MVRLYDDQARLVMLALAYLEHSVEANSTYLCKYVSRNPSFDKLNPVETQQLSHATSTLLQRGAPELGEVSKVLAAQINKDNGHDSDLVETIVSYLGLQHPRNRGITGGHLEELRRAILLPEELRTLKEKIKANELECPQCRHRFQDGEMLTVTVDRAGATLNCVRCRLPMYVVCMKGAPGDEGHESVATLDQRDLQRIARTTCYTHKAGNTEAGTVDATDVAARVNQARAAAPTPRNRIREIVLGGARRGGDTFIIDESAAPMFSARWDEIAVPPAAPTVPTTEDTDDGFDGIEDR